jgi:sugar phosphate isomerase/epimerase
MTNQFQFSIATGWDDFPEKLRFAERHEFGLEIGALYAGPPVWDLETRSKMEGELSAALRDFPYGRSLHGAFIDIAVHSADPGIAAVARERILRDLETACQLGCQTVVFHTGFNPLVPGQQYGHEFLERHAAFWPAVADRFPGITICLENMWEPSPRLLERLLRGIHHPRVGLCLDVAHAHAYSPFPVEEWLNQPGGRILHMHWNDNHGDTDSHLPIGQGNIPWKNVQTAARRVAPGATVVLELKAMRAIRQSLKYLEQSCSTAASSRQVRNRPGAATRLRRSRTLHRV